MITLRFACGHTGKIDPDKTDVLRCSCGESRIEYVSAPPPRFTGTVSGPLAQTVALGPIPVDLAPSGAIPLKPMSED